MITSHEKLKEIADTIGYTHHTGDFYEGCNLFLKYEPHYTLGTECENVIDVREIIFTTEFRMLCMGYLQFTQSEVHFDSIMEHLGNPIDYLYKLIKG